MNSIVDNGIVLGPRVLCVLYNLYFQVISVAEC